jgi:hypothetical protein
MFKLMKRFHSLIVVAAMTMIVSGSVVADNPFDKFGRGRLLRKWRDELTGKNKKPAPKPALKGSGKQPTPARKAPTPAKKTTSSPQRKGSNVRSSTPTANRQANKLHTRSAYQPRTTQPRTTQPRTTQPRSASSATRRPVAAGKAVGLGMQVVEKSDQYVVAQVTPGGNAAKAGILRGDLIVKFAGADLGSIEEYNEISKILGEGDQIEIQVSRRGKKAELTVQNGELPELPEPSEEEVASNSSYSRLTDSTSRPQLESKSASNSQFEFVPKSGSSSGLRSVLEQSPQSYRAPQSRQRSPSLNGPGN